ncbi:MAG: AAA family ATPase [Candidatus Magnetomorum sp.]|nr:AAA family ATPase [Candidatus Magnetomorum sp.]
MPRYDIVFEHRPIHQENFISDTFINRDEDIQKADLLFDPQNQKDMVYVIHGESRIGKSHLAIYLMEQFYKKYNMIYFYINANTRGYASDILKTLLDQLADHVHSLKPEQYQNEHEFLKTYLNDLGNVFYGVPGKIAFKKSREFQQKLSPSFKARFPFLDVQLGENQDRKKQNELSVEFTKISDFKFRDILSRCFELLSFITGQPLLLLVDDLDLLEEIDEGEKQRDILSNHLKYYATIKKVTVFSTIRTQYFTERQKELHDFIKVSRLSNRDLKAIYQKRIDAYHKSIPIFSDDILSRLINGFNGYVGIFLYECYLIMRTHLIKIHNNQVVEEQLLKAYFKKELDSFASNPETKPVFDQILTGIKSDHTEIDIANLMPSQGFIYRVLIPKGYKHNKDDAKKTYDVLPIWVQAIREYYDQ